jgi:hypothetical protein
MQALHHATISIQAVRRKWPVLADMSAVIFLRASLVTFRRKTAFSCL